MPIKFFEKPFYPVSPDGQFLTADADTKTILPLVVININQGDTCVPRPLALLIDLLVLPGLGQQGLFR